MCTNELKSTKAITLIALVITIKTYSIASAQEKIELLIAEASYDYLQERYVNGNGSINDQKDDYIVGQLKLQESNNFEGCEFLKDVNLV